MAKLENGRISGTLDYYGSQFETLERIRAKILGTFTSFGYVPAELPILQAADIFLERSGEELRRRLYVFNDPSGRERCLRPEFNPDVSLLLTNASPAKCRDPPVLLRFCLSLRISRERALSAVSPGRG